MVHRMARFNRGTTGMMMRTGGGRTGGGDAARSLTGVGAGRGRQIGRSLRFATAAGGETTAMAESSSGLPLGAPVTNDCKL